MVFHVSWSVFALLLLAGGALGWVYYLRERKLLRELFEQQPQETLEPLTKANVAHPEATAALDYARQALQAPGAETEADEKALAEVDAFAGLLEQRLRSGEYLTLESQDSIGRLNFGALQTDISDYLRAIARHYRPGEEDPLLELRPIDIAHVVHRSSMILLGVVERAPMRSHEMTLRELIEWFYRARQVLSRYTQLQEIWNKYHLGRLWRSAQWMRLALAPTPAGIAMVVGGEMARQLVHKHGPDVIFALVVRQRIELVARTVGYEAMRSFGSGIQFRTYEWLVGCELAVLFRDLRLGPQATRELLQELARLRFATVYERFALLGFLGDSAGLDRWLDNNQEPIARLTEEERDAAARTCQKFISRSHDAGSPRQQAFARGFAARWGRNLTLTAGTDTALWEACCRSWNDFLACECNLAEAEERRRLLADVAEQVGQPLALPDDDELTPVDAFEPVVLDPDSALFGSYIDGLVELCARAPRRDCAVEMALERVDRFYPARLNLRQKLHKHWTRQLRQACEHNAVVDDIDPLARCRLLAALQDGEAVRAVYRGKETDADGKQQDVALAVTSGRVLLAFGGETVPQERAEPLSEGECVVDRRAGLVASELTLAWEPVPGRTRQVVVDGSLLRSAQARYRSLLVALQQRGAVDRAGWFGGGTAT